MDVKDWEPWVKIATPLIGLVVAAWRWGKPFRVWLHDLQKFPSRVRENTDILAREIRPNGTPLCEKISNIEEQTELCNARFAMMANTSVEPIFECDSTGQCVFVSKSVCEMFGMSYKDMLGNGWLLAIDNPEERSKVWEYWKHDIANNIPHRDRFTIHNQMTNKAIKVEASAVVHRGRKSGKILAYQVSLKAINDPIPAE